MSLGSVKPKRSRVAAVHQKVITENRIMGEFINKSKSLFFEKENQPNK